MSHQFSKIMNSLEPPLDLFNKVMGRIEKEKFLVIKRKFLFYAFSLVATIGSSIPLWSIFRGEIMQSGFRQYMTVLFYDFGEVIRHFGDFTFSVLESLPVLSIVSFLSVLLAALYFLKAIVRYGHLLYKFSHSQLTDIK